MNSKIEEAIISFFWGKKEFLKDGNGNYSENCTGIRKMDVDLEIQNSNGLFSDFSSDEVKKKFDYYIENGYISVKQGKMKRLGSVFCLTKKGFKEFLDIDI